jgi:aerobic carbon-monoxide dehydrogenase medium subunit
VSASGFAYGSTDGFGYLRPRSPGEVSAILAAQPDAHLLAGGTDLLVEIRNRELLGGVLVDLKALPGLRAIRADGDVLEIGALATVNEVMADARVQRDLPILVQAGAVFGCHEIRHRATVGGNIAHASPGAEYATPLLVLGATAVIESAAGQRTVRLEEFFVGPGRSCLARAQGEWLSALRVPLPRTRAAMAYRRYARVKGMDLASACISVLVTEPGDVARRAVRIALGAVAPVPALRAEAGALLSGRPWTPELVAEARGLMLAGIEPRRSSIRSTPEYKRHVLGVYLEDILRSLDEVRP